MTFGFGFGLSLGGSRAGGGPSYDAATVAYLAAMSVQPDATRAGLLNDLIAGLKTDGVWAKLDWLTIHAAHDEQAGRVNAVTPGQVATAPVAPSFTTDRGHTGNGTTQYLDSGWNPLTASSPKYVQNDAHQGVWCGTNVNEGKYEIGNGVGRIATRTGGNITVQPNSGSGTNTAVATSIGHTMWSRTGASAGVVYKNGGLAVSFGTASTAPTNGKFIILASNTSTTDGITLTGVSSKRIQAVHWGSQLSTAEALALYTRLATYMTAVGA